MLVAIAEELPRSSLDELTREFNRRSALSVCSATVRKALKQAGIQRLRPTRKPAERAAAHGGTPLRVGYVARHRRSDGPSGMSTDLTEAEWALVARCGAGLEGLARTGPRTARRAVPHAEHAPDGEGGAVSGRPRRAQKL